jgi:hypothetical protein
MNATHHDAEPERLAQGREGHYCIAVSLSDMHYQIYDQYLD